MATKTNGAELKAFYADDSYWQAALEGKEEDIWHEDLVLVVNGVEREDDFSIDEELRDEDQVTIVAGVVLSTFQDFKDRSFESFFKAWRKQQSTVYLSVTVPKEKLAAVREAIIAAGGSVK